MVRRLVFIILGCLTYGFLALAGAVLDPGPGYGSLFLFLKLCLIAIILLYILEGLSRISHPEAYMAEEP